MYYFRTKKNIRAGKRRTAAGALPEYAGEVSVACAIERTKNHHASSPSGAAILFFASACYYQVSMT